MNQIQVNFTVDTASVSGQKLLAYSFTYLANKFSGNVNITESDEQSYGKLLKVLDFVKNLRNDLPLGAVVLHANKFTLEYTSKNDFAEFEFNNVTFNVDALRYSLFSLLSKNGLLMPVLKKPEQEKSVRFEEPKVTPVAVAPEPVVTQPKKTVTKSFAVPEHVQKKEYPRRQQSTKSETVQQKEQPKEQPKEQLVQQTEQTEQPAQQMYLFDFDGEGNLKNVSQTNGSGTNVNVSSDSVPEFLKTFAENFGKSLASKVAQPVAQPKVAQPISQPKVQPKAQPTVAQPISQPKAQSKAQPTVAQQTPPKNDYMNIFQQLANTTNTAPVAQPENPFESLYSFFPMLTQPTQQVSQQQTAQQTAQQLAQQRAYQSQQTAQQTAQQLAQQRAYQSQQLAQQQAQQLAQQQAQQLAQQQAQQQAQQPLDLSSWEKILGMPTGYDTAPLMSFLSQFGVNKETVQDKINMITNELSRQMPNTSSQTHQCQNNHTNQNERDFDYFSNRDDISELLNHLDE